MKGKNKLSKMARKFAAPLALTGVLASGYLSAGCEGNVNEESIEERFSRLDSTPGEALQSVIRMSREDYNEGISEHTSLNDWDIKKLITAKIGPEKFREYRGFYANVPGSVVDNMVMLHEEGISPKYTAEIIEIYGDEFHVPGSLSLNETGSGVYDIVNLHKAEVPFEFMREMKDLEKYGAKISAADTVSLYKIHQDRKIAIDELKDSVLEGMVKNIGN